jgi:catechol 2,3-dioxygenase-like lactoylglutathione lyase family enzyme
MAVRSLWHMGITVSDMERSITFYRDLLGLEIRHQQIQDNPYTRKLIGYPDTRLRAVQFRIPNAPTGPSGHVLELTQYFPAGSSLELRTANVGVAHLAIEVDDMDGIYRRMKAADVEFVSPPVLITEGINKNGYACYLRDPDGITLELVQPPPRARDMHEATAATASPGNP